MRKAVGCGRFEPYGLQQRGSFSERFLRPSSIGDRSRCYDPTHAFTRVERTIRVLENHLDAPTNCAQMFSSQCGHILSTQHHSSATWLLKADQPTPKKALSRSAHPTTAIHSSRRM